MPPDNQPNQQYWDLFRVLIISAMSGFISVGRRFMRETDPSILWVLCEFLACLLAGYLASGAYPEYKESLPKGVTLPIFVAICAHFGGRFFQLSELAISVKLGKPKPPSAP
ncbi:hypothetical protein L7B14_004191 [Salmonella enterica]|nr:hypothetical protein [Salmonella enterica]